MFTIGDSVQIQGCSTKKRILETSSGCDSFDTLCGGSLTNSSIVLIDEYRSRHYASYLVKYFLAEGITHKHNCVIVDPCEDVSSILLKSIPSRKSEKPADSQLNQPPGFRPSNENDMKIAWRYGNIAKVDSSLSSSSKSESVYDFANPLELEPTDIEVLEPKNGEYSFQEVYDQLQNIIRKNETHTKENGKGGPKKNLLRIVIRNIDSGLWKDSHNLPRFLVLLRSLIRSSYAIVYLTANSYSVEELEWRKIESIADCHVQLIGFDEQEKKTFRHLGSVHGYFRLKNLPRLATLGTHTPPILDLIFEAQSRKGFQIRIMHLPPALDDPTPATAKPNCSKFDF